MEQNPKSKNMSNLFEKIPMKGLRTLLLLHRVKVVLENQLFLQTWLFHLQETGSALRLLMQTFSGRQYLKCLALKMPDQMLRLLEKGK